jgi:hypothetical protein
MPVRAQHQLALRAAPHPPDMLHRQNRQNRSRLFRILNRILSAFKGIRDQTYEVDRIQFGTRAAPPGGNLQNEAPEASA